MVSLPGYLLPWKFMKNWLIEGALFKNVNMRRFQQCESGGNFFGVVGI